MIIDFQLPLTTAAETPLDGIKSEVREIFGAHFEGTLAFDRFVAHAHITVKRAYHTYRRKPMPRRQFQSKCYMWTSACWIPWINKLV